MAKMKSILADRLRVALNNCSGYALDDLPDDPMDVDSPPQSPPTGLQQGDVSALF